ncbi:hypothetical protein D3C75_805410 [compost metagenome]
MRLAMLHDQPAQTCRNTAVVDDEVLAEQGVNFGHPRIEAKAFRTQDRCLIVAGNYRSLYALQHSAKPHIIRLQPVRIAGHNAAPAHDVDGCLKSV